MAERFRLVRPAEEQQPAPLPAPDTSTLRIVPPEETPGFLERVGQGAVDIASGIGEAVVGRPVGFEGAPELVTIAGQIVNDPDQPASVRGPFGRVGTKLFAARNDRDVEAIVRDEFPDAIFFEDEEGNRYGRAGGQTFIFNRPGVSSGDLPFFALESLGLGAGAGLGGAMGGAARAIGPTTGLLGRTAGVAAGTGAGSLGMDVTSNLVGADQGVDLTKALVAAATAGGLEFAAPFIVQGVRRALRRRPFSRGGRLTEAGAAALRESGLDPERVPPDIIQQFERALVEGGTAGAAARAADVAMLPSAPPLTAAQRTGSPTLAALESEAKKGVHGEGPALAMRGMQDVQQEALGRNIPIMQQELSPEGQVFAPGEGGQFVQESLLRRQAQMRADVRAAYDLAEEQGRARISPEGTARLQSAMQDAVSEWDIDAPGMERAKREFDKFMEITSNPSGGVRPADVQRLYGRWRKQARKAASGAPRGSEIEGAVTAMIKRFDDEMDEAVREAVIIGDPEAIDLWRKAIARRREMGQVFGGKTNIIGDIVKVDRDGAVDGLAIPPERVTALIFGTARLGSKGRLLKDVRRLREVLGPDSPEWHAIRGEAFLRLFRTVKEGQPFPARSYTEELNDLIDNNAALARELFTPSEIANMQRLGRAARLVNEADAITKNVNPSGTSAALQQGERGLPSQRGRQQAVNAGMTIARLANAFGALGEVVLQVAGSRLRIPTAQRRAAMQSVTGQAPGGLPRGPGAVSGIVGGVQGRREQRKRQRQGRQ